MNLENLRSADHEIYESIGRELERQRSRIELIASENFVSPAVLEAAGSILTNKYAEGYPGKRYYGGCEFVDEVENLARERLKELFGAEHANVQPHSGSNANLGVYFAVLDPGDVVLGMNLSHGGHLTHGSHVNLSGKYFRFLSYGVDKESGRIDYDSMEKLAMESSPKLIVAGASAYPRIIDFERVKYIADKVGAIFMVDMAHIAGLVAAGLHPSPIPYADFVTTTTHKTLRGPRGGAILCRAEFAKAVDKAIFPGIQGGPLMHVIAAKAVCFKEALSEEFKAYQHKVVKNASALASGLTENGFKLISGGTDNHLVLVDLRNKGITGKAAEALLDEIGITTNKNTVPYDTQSPTITSGLRIGTPAVTTRGFDEEDMKAIAGIISMILEQPEKVQEARGKVEEICAKHPLY